MSQPLDLTWRRDGADWVLFHKRRRFGRVVPDATVPGMWRSIKPDGQLSGPANLSWAKNAVLVVAERELEFEARQRRAIDPAKSQETEGVFSGSGLPMRFSGRGSGDRP